jgi:hypothetical protein
LGPLAAATSPWRVMLANDRRLPRWRGQGIQIVLPGAAPPFSALPGDSVDSHPTPTKSIRVRANPRLLLLLPS